MAITSEHLVGAAVGVGVAAVGFYLYQKNQDKINEFLRSHGLDIPVTLPDRRERRQGRLYA